MRPFGGAQDGLSGRRLADMASYAIGDLQGCYATLERLLDAINYDARNDRLWFTGDLVNRGDDSLRCLRFVRACGERAVTVLGNHDFHLICVEAGIERLKKGDTMQDVLAAPDRRELVDWLATRPLAFREDGFVLVHAGVHPAWYTSQLLELAAEVEATMRSEVRNDFLRELYGDQPRAWRDDLRGVARLRFVVNVLARMRFVDAQGAVDLRYKGEIDGAPHGLRPWFELIDMRKVPETIIFGHWSALGLRVEPKLLALDTGCVWGRELTAVRLEDRRVFQVPNGEAGPPNH